MSKNEILLCVKNYLKELSNKEDGGNERRN